MFFLVIVCEVLFIIAVVLLLAIFAPPMPALIISFACLLVVYFLRPAHRLDRHLRRNRRRVIRRYRPPAVPDHITLRPMDHLTPAEVFRLMEIIGVMPIKRLASADFTATLLDLNRRGIVTLSMTDADALLRSDGVRVSIRHGVDRKQLAPHEEILLRMLQNVQNGASSLQLSAFDDVFTRMPLLSRRKTDAFRRAVDRALQEKKMLARVKGGTPHAARRMLLLTRRGEQSAALWRVYFSNICTHPFLDSYRPRSAEQGEFAKETFQLLVDAAAGGCCARAAACIQREYVFDPADLWKEGQYFSFLTGARTAFSSTDGGEDYFFLPLRDFEHAIQTVILYETLV